jgi:hypothetical protein
MVEKRESDPNVPGSKTRRYAAFTKVFSPAQNERSTPTSLSTLGRTALWRHALSGGCPGVSERRRYYRGGRRLEDRPDDADPQARVNERHLRARQAVRFRESVQPRVDQLHHTKSRRRAQRTETTAALTPLAAAGGPRRDQSTRTNASTVSNPVQPRYSTPTYGTPCVSTSRALSLGTLEC